MFGVRRSALGGRCIRSVWWRTTSWGPILTGSRWQSSQTSLSWPLNSIVRSRSTHSTVS